MEKPIIIVCGVPHSYTSMISKFLIDNGAFTNEIRQNPKYDIPYPTYEEKEIQQFVENRKKFKNYDLNNYFESLPDNKVAIAKEPLSIFFLNDFKKYTDRKIKVVFVLRNPEQMIISSMEKGGKSFIYHFNRLSWIYDFMVQCEYPLLPFVAERIKNDGERLIKFCELSPSEIDYDSIREMKSRKPTYLKYRFANFFWKRLSKFFKIFH